MKYAVTHPRETHGMDLLDSWRDAFGLRWHLFLCPTCGRRVQVGRRLLVLDPGTMAMSAEDAERAIVLRNEGRHGEANTLLASFPGHKYQAPGFELGGVGFEHNTD